MAIFRTPFDNYDDKPITEHIIELVDFEELEQWLFFEFTEDNTESITKSLSILTGFYDQLDSFGKKIVNMTMVCMFGWQLTSIYHKALERQTDETRTTLDEALKEIENYCWTCGSELDEIDKEDLQNSCTDCYHRANYGGYLEPE